MTAMRRPTAPVPAQGRDSHDSGLASDVSAEDEVIAICHDLLQIDTSNYGDNSGPGERAAAELVAELLSEAGLAPEMFESAPGRTSLVTRFPGEDDSRPALLIHGHLDVVPAQASDWQVDPFSAELKDDCLWGRGAVDMKNMDAIMLASIRAMVREGRRPPRDLVIAFFADEEAGGKYGAHHVVDQHADVFEGVSEAVSEVGGFSVDLNGRRTYLLQTAEKGIAWLKLTARGRAGHGSQVNPDNAVTHIAAAMARIGQHQWPIEIPPTVRAFIDGVREQTGISLSSDAGDFDVDALRDLFGTTARWLEATVQNTSNPTVLKAGYKQNVIPGEASALIDCRFLPGQRDELMATISKLAGDDVTVETVHSEPALEAEYGTGIVQAMRDALQAEDPGSAVLPYCLSGGTDNKSMSQLDIPGYGFAPLKLPPGLDFAGMFHGVDERVPLEALRFGVRTFDRFISLS